MTRQSAVERSEEVARAAPLLTEALGQVAHPPVRHRGTVGRAASSTPTRPPSCPRSSLALDGEIVLRGPDGERRVPAAEFFTGAVHDGARARASSSPRCAFPPLRRRGHAFVEFSRRHADFAVAGRGA